MMGFGNGGTPSPSSNLSALAPPFTVDRSNPNLNSNPLVNFSEPPPSYAVPYHSSFPNWQYSHPSASRPDSFFNHGSEVDSIRTTCLPSSHDYQYFGSHPVVSSPTSHVPPPNPKFSDAKDTFTFMQYSSEIPGNHDDSKPYFSPFVAPVIHDDIPLVALNEPSYDLLSTSRAGPLDGCVQVDYAQSLSGLEYMPQWGSSWNRLPNPERLELDGIFSSDEKNIAGSYVHTNYMKPGASTCVDFLSKCEEASTFPRRKQVDVSGRENQISSPSAEKLNGKSSSLQDFGFISNESSRPSGSSKFPESQGSSPEPAANFWNNQKPYAASYDESFQPLDFCLNDSISAKKSSPALVIRPPTTVSSEDKNPIGNAAAIDVRNFDFHDPSKRVPHLLRSYGKEGCLDTSQPNLHVEKSGRFFVSSSSTRKEVLENKAVTKDVLDCISMAGTKVSDGFSLAFDSAKAFTSGEDSSESIDQYNPAVDSPCWKGAPASPFSSFVVSEAENPQHVMKRLEVGNSLNLQQNQSFPPCTLTTEKVNQENGYVELGSLLCPERLSNTNCSTREHSSTDEEKVGFSYPKVCSSKWVHFSSDINKPRKDYGVSDDPKSDPGLKPDHSKELGLDEGEILSEREFKLYMGVVADTGLNKNDALGDGSVHFHGMESTSCLPCSAENVNKLAELHATESAPNMNVQTMVNTIRNLSELLLFHWTNDASAVSDEDHEAIKHVISNLDACVSKKIARMTPTQESMSPHQGTSHEPDFHKGVTAARPPLRKEADASSHGQLDHHSILEGKRNSISSGKAVEKFPDSVSLRDDAYNIKADKMVQAIKELLKEDFNSEEGMQPEALLFKDLWLEAEAGLCSINYKARFNRMKIEMEKCKSHNVKDYVEATMVAEQLSRSMVSSDPNITQKVTPEAKDNPISDDFVQDSPISNKTKIVNDVEASVRARINVLKRRGQSSNSVINTEGQRPTDVVDDGFVGKINNGPLVGNQSEDRSLDVAISNKTKIVSDVEASVRARFDILKRRGHSSNYAITSEGQRLTEVVDDGYAGKINDWPLVGNQLEDETLDIADEAYWQSYGGNTTVDKYGSQQEIMEEFRVCPTDDKVVGSGMNNWLRSPILPGWCESSSSDWEHVLKDEFTDQK